MLNKIVFRNFKSFTDLTLDLHVNAKKAKKFAAIYGENGSGKSHVVDAVRILRVSMITLVQATEFGRFRDKLISENNGINVDIPQDFPSTFPNVVNGTHRIGRQDDTSLEFELLIDGVNANYTVAYNASGMLTHERLDYLGNKSRVTLFDITSDTGVINQEIHKNFFAGDNNLQKGFISDLNQSIVKYWGKHSLLAILQLISYESNSNYLALNLNNNVREFINQISTISMIGHNQQGIVNTGEISDFVSGVTSLENENELTMIEHSLYLFFSALYADILDVHYVKQPVENGIRYDLYFTKLSTGEKLEIPFVYESEGTNNLMKLFPYLLNAIKGYVVVIDEIDNGIHDLLMKVIISHIQDAIQGQLIFTTHNTLMLNEIETNQVYLLNVDNNGTRDISTISEYKKTRTAANNNVQKKYLSGAYDGIPYTTDIDFETIANDWIR
jgi:AAA15 family ATPase/GTPase